MWPYGLGGVRTWTFSPTEVGRVRKILDKGHGAHFTCITAVLSPFLASVVLKRESQLVWLCASQGPGLSGTPSHFILHMDCMIPVLFQIGDKSPVRPEPRGQ